MPVSLNRLNVTFIIHRIMYVLLNNEVDLNITSYVTNKWVQNSYLYESILTTDGSFSANQRSLKLLQSLYSIIGTGR